MGIFKIKPLEVISPFATQLVGLGNSNLNPDEQRLLQLAIDYLLTQLDNGHSCVKIDRLSKALPVSTDELHTLLQKSDLVGELTQVTNSNIHNKPLSVVAIPGQQSLIYITRYLHYELQISKYLSKLVTPLNIDAKFQHQAEDLLLQLSKQKHGLPNEQQHLAILNSLKQQFSIITGAPGTGKTTTVILLLYILYQYYGGSLKVKICAPTGKAAARVKESIQNSLEMFSAHGIDIKQQVFTKLIETSSNFGTIHKLLGARPNQIYFKHDQTNPLDAEVLIIDESSMIGLPLFSKLIQAINPTRTKHIILLGDKNQLSSVEEGYVFASLVNYFLKIKSQVVIELTESKRNIGDIGKLANYILGNQIDAALETLQTADNTKLVGCSFKPLLFQTCYGSDPYSYTNYIAFIKQHQHRQEIDTNYRQELFKHYMQFIVLCLSNNGLFGTTYQNLQIEKHIKLQLNTNNLWYPGRPIIINKNDQALDLYNGDIGICQLLNDKLVVIFNNGTIYVPEILPPHKLAYAITIHKAQGSEFDSVAIVLSDDGAATATDNLLVKELVYTAVTRAKNNAIIYSGREKLKFALGNHTLRESGLEYFLHQ